jgi:uncharacterized protein (DUF1330 family)
MSAYLVVDIAVHDPEMFKEYARKSQPLVEKHGGVYLARGGEVDIQEGTWSPQRLVVVEFPTKEKAKAFLADPGYLPVAALRHEAATTNMIIVDGFQPAS